MTGHVWEPNGYTERLKCPDNLLNRISGDNIRWSEGLFHFINNDRRAKNVPEHCSRFWVDHIPTKLVSLTLRVFIRAS